MADPGLSRPVAPEVERVFREEADRVLATLIRLLGDFDLAEEAQQEAFAAALAQWPVIGLPANPRAWLVRVGRNKGIDTIRRRVVLRTKLPGLESEAVDAGPDEAEDDEDFGDDRLRLIFSCCHPALAIESQVALTLRTVCNLPTHAIARVFLTSEEAMAQRLVRIKSKIRDSGIPYETPAPEALEERLDGVLAVIYLVFTEGYAASRGADLIHEELCREAIRLARVLDSLLPGRVLVRELLALMLLHDARRRARTNAAGDIVLLDEQDRSLWDQQQIAEGLQLVDEALQRRGRVSAYAVQAAIAALHARAPSKESTDWAQIVGLYEVLLRLQPTPIVELNHAVAVSMVDGPARALDLVDSLAAHRSFSDHHLLLAVRADLLRRLGRMDEALAAYRAAHAAAQLEPEQRFFARRIAELSGQDSRYPLQP
jgi:RNA polymerase sigma-70 factor (ECF subfamily)